MKHNTDILVQFSEAQLQNDAAAKMELYDFGPQVSPTDLLITLEFTTAVFWTLDIVSNFATGYNKIDRWLLLFLSGRVVFV